MKRSMLLILTLSLAVCASAMADKLSAPAVPPQIPAQNYPSPQEAAPNVYTQLFENERVIVNEIKFAPGDKAPMHTHAYDHVVYVIEPGQLTITHPDGTSMVKDAKAGDVMFMPAETHEAVNTGTTTLRATVTEIKG